MCWSKILFHPANHLTIHPWTYLLWTCYIPRTLGPFIAPPLPNTKCSLFQLLQKMARHNKNNNKKQEFHARKIPILSLGFSTVNGVNSIFCTSSAWEINKIAYVYNVQPWQIKQQTNVSFFSLILQMARYSLYWSRISLCKINMVDHLINLNFYLFG